MKKSIIISFLFFSLAALLSSCMEEDDHLFTTLLIEFEDATQVNNAPAKNYPFLEPMSPDADSRAYQVNLLGGQSGQDQVLAYDAYLVVDDVEGEEVATYDDILEGGTFTIPASSSFGEVSIEAPDPEALPDTGEGETMHMVIELTGNEEIGPSENYKHIGIPIDLEE